MSAGRTGCGCGGCASCSSAAQRPAVADPLTFRQRAIKARMLARLSTATIEGRRPLADLGTRDDDDPTIALLDAYAGALHVLAWNAGRLADDGSIRRTEDRDALVDLTRLLGYEPRPAISATTTLAFLLDDFKGSPAIVTIPQGTKVASVPGQDELPQTFETSTEIEARPEWNELRPVLAQTVPTITTATTSITIRDATTPARSGDLLLVHLQAPGSTSGTSWLLARVAGVTRRAELKPPQTTIELAPMDVAAGVELGGVQPGSGETFENCVVLLGQRAAAFGATAPDYKLIKETQDATAEGVFEMLELRESAAERVVPERRLRGTGARTDWDLEMQPGGPSTGASVDLDAIYAEAMPGRFVVFSASTASPSHDLGRITSVVERSRADYGLAAKITRVGLVGVSIENTSYGFRKRVRETTIYLETARETLLVEDADVALPASPTNRITVRGKVELPAGRRIALWGEPWPETTPTERPEEDGPRTGEVAVLGSSSSVGTDTELVFDDLIRTSFRATTLRLLANAVMATHGETPTSGAELIGSGSAASQAPRFALKRSPLTFLASPGPRGYEPAIEVRVDDRRYEERRTLYGLGSEDRAFTVKVGRDAVAEVQFPGRLPTGTYNVTALYRTGSGTAGNLDAKRLTTSMTPVLGVRTVLNPVPAEGGSDPESIDDMREAAPRSIRTLDRIVSLADFEAFARSRAGIGKALATELRAGMRSIVCITVATTDLEPPAAGSEVVRNLVAGIAAAAVPGRSVRVEGFDDLVAQVTIELAVDPAFRRGDVEARVREVLGAAFGREQRPFAAALPRSALLSTVQGVRGVIAARISRFQLPDGTLAADGRLACPGPTMVDGVFSRGALLSVDPNAVEFGEMLP